jgi:hypothetical protein
MSLLAVLASLMLPKRATDGEEHGRGKPFGEKMIMAEQTVINARNQPAVRPK